MINDDDVIQFFQKLNSVLISKFHAFAYGDFCDWKISRMDVCWNFQVGGDVSDYILAFSNINLPRYTTSLYNKKETVVWSNKSKRMQFYDKNSEVIAKNGSQSEVELSRGLLRFKANLGVKDLQTYVQDRNASDLLKWRAAKYFLEKHLFKLKLDEHILINTKINMMQTLIEAYGITKAESLLGFIELNNAYGNTLKRMMTTSTYRRRVDDFSALGLSPVISEKVLSPLDISQIVA